MSRPAAALRSSSSRARCCPASRRSTTRERDAMRPRRPRWVLGNWKMNRTAPEAAALAQEIRALVGTSPGCRVGVCPPFTALDAVRVALAGGPVTLGAQNLHAEPKGAFTGEVSGPMLLAAGCEHVLVGHSERRH